VEQDRGAVFLELEDRGALARRPGLEAPYNRIGTHPHLLERGLDLVEGQPPVGGKGQSREEENRGRRPVRLSREVGQAVEDGVNLSRLLRIRATHETHLPSSLP